MLHRIRPVHIFLFVLSLISLIYLRGVASVPFHPDESAYFFMSSDLGTLLKHPTALFLQEDIDERARLRLLDPPLIHFAIEAGRRLGGFQPLPVNWYWDKTWIENEQGGAIPQARLLLAGRLAVACLFPFSLLFFYLAMRRVFNEFTAWGAALLMAANPLILLHTRRAMAEGILVFALSLTLWVLVKADKRPWLAGLAVGLAFCAKQSLVGLGVVGLLAVVWQPGRSIPLSRRAWQMGLYGLLFLGVVFALMPVAWKDPIHAMQAASRLRQSMMQNQLAQYPAQAINTPGERVASLVNQIYFAPPIFSEDARYAEAIQPAETAYLANPLNYLPGSPRSPLTGGIFLGFTLLGLAAGCYQAGSLEPVKKRRFILVLLATFLQAAALLAAVPLSWQRYYLPLVPFTCIWAAYGIDQLKGLAVRPWLKRVVLAH